MAKSTNKKRKVIVESNGEAHINASFNNIIISITNLKGEVISWSSAGKMGFKGSKKILLSQHKQLLKIVQKQLLMLALEELKSLLKDQEMEENLR